MYRKYVEPMRCAQLNILQFNILYRVHRTHSYTDRWGFTNTPSKCPKYSHL